MYEIVVESHIDAAHYLREYNGKCENLHGHRYKIVVHVTAEKLNKIGLAYDFTDLKKHLNAICDQYDHTCLNDTPPFDKINASSENLASTIYKELKKKLLGEARSKIAKEDVVLTAVEVWETPFQGVTYRE
jgi:6-pyruvoyltetrahydropterin/6-carboxytetrahydropterin synthase